MLAAKYRLGNLVAILDYNGAQQTGATADVLPHEPIAAKWAAFGWHVQEIGGHNVHEVLEALDRATKCASGPPSSARCYGRRGNPALDVLSYAVLYFRISILHAGVIMPDIAIAESTFERLQHHARPLLDTTDMVVNRALDALENGAGQPDPGDEPGVPVRQIDPRKLPNLTHTKVLDASLDGERVARPRWNLLLSRVLIRAMSRASGIDELRRFCPANMLQGRKEDEGYRYLPEIDISVQGMAANEACRALVTAAQSVGIELDVVFMWRPREGATHPGEQARLKVGGGAARCQGAGQSAAGE